jgi:hypothetical protein
MNLIKETMILGNVRVGRTDDKRIGVTGTMKLKPAGRVSFIVDTAPV